MIGLENLSSVEVLNEKALVLNYLIKLVEARTENSYKFYLTNMVNMMRLMTS